MNDELSTEQLDQVIAGYQDNAVAMKINMENATGAFVSDEELDEEKLKQVTAGMPNPEVTEEVESLGR